MAKTQPDSCGLGPAFQVIGGKWKALVLWTIRTEPRRFGALKRLIPDISEKMLIQQLREMEADGLVRREVFHESPPRVEYSATELGVSLDDALGPLAAWGKMHGANIEARKPQQG
ncbi:helix-turn-helix domain-containing protein [Brevundimonas sp.]|uniref:winged helix-turn-helix transcriptional regulator n=1 Tax=Brevundimonas sp. TaxID=1871086 RepID=UPI0028AAA8DC|nr:helix-turn-helix domain-containing protein [Brevundimonas sp.]